VGELLIASGYRRKVEELPPTEDGWPTFGENSLDHRRLIIVNKSAISRNPVLTTIVHEEVHGVYPELGEREIGALTDEIVKGLQPTEKRRYYNLYRNKK